MYAAFFLVWKRNDSSIQKFLTERSNRTHKAGQLSINVFKVGCKPPQLELQSRDCHEAAERFGDKLMFVHAEDLTKDPQSVMNNVWEFLGEEPFIHNTSNVEQYTKENDVGFPYGDHVIRQEVKPLKQDWHETLGRQLSEQLNQKFNWINEL